MTLFLILMGVGLLWWLPFERKGATAEPLPEPNADAVVREGAAVWGCLGYLVLVGPAVLVAAILLSACGGGPHATCAKDGDCRRGLVCFAPTEALRGARGAAGLDEMRLVPYLTPFTCVSPDEWLSAQRQANAANAGGIWAPSGPAVDEHGEKEWLARWQGLCSPEVAARKAEKVAQ